MYLGAALVLLGFGLWNTSTTISLFSLAFVLVAHVFVILYEEPALERRFGLSYQQYRATVRRWLPKKPIEQKGRIA
jgi:protein-S-isoprenylcysteine O-methyltransferase Ste14